MTDIAFLVIDGWLHATSHKTGRTRGESGFIFGSQALRQEAAAIAVTRVFQQIQAAKDGAGAVDATAAGSGTAAAEAAAQPGAAGAMDVSSLPPPSQAHALSPEQLR